MKLLLTTARNRFVRHLSQALAVRHRVVLTDTLPVRTRHAFVPCILNHRNTAVGRGSGCNHLDGLDGPFRGGLLSTGSPDALSVQPALGGVGGGCSPRGSIEFPRCHGPVSRRSPDHRAMVALAGRETADARLPPGRDRVPRVRERGKTPGRLSQAGFDPVEPELSCADGVTVQDAVQAVGGALTAELPGYSVFHIQSGLPGQRYGTERARRILGFNSTWRPA